MGSTPHEASVPPGVRVGKLPSKNGPIGSGVERPGGGITKGTNAAPQKNKAITKSLKRSLFDLEKKGSEKSVMITWLL